MNHLRVGVRRRRTVSYQTPDIVQAALADGSTDTAVPTLSVTPTPGNLLIATFRPSNSNTAIDPTISGSGWTLLGQPRTSSGRAAWWYKVAGSSEPASVTMDDTNTAGTVDGRLIEFSGASGILEVPVVDGSTGSAVMSATVGPTTATTHPVLVVDFVAATGGLTAVSNTLTAVTPSSTRLQVGWASDVTLGTKSATVSWTTTGRAWGGGIAVFRAKTA